MAFGSVKSQAFSARPTKSRIAGSAVHTRRSAARVSSCGTPGERKARMSVAEVIDSSDGSLVRSNSGGGLAAVVRYRDCRFGIAVVAWWRVSVASRCLFARPALQEILGLAHVSSSRSAGRPPSERVKVGAVARALDDSCSTWCSATKAATVSRIESASAPSPRYCCPPSSLRLRTDPRSRDRARRAAQSRFRAAPPTAKARPDCRLVL